MKSLCGSGVVLRAWCRSGVRLRFRRHVTATEAARFRLRLFLRRSASSLPGSSPARAEKQAERLLGERTEGKSPACWTDAASSAHIQELWRSLRVTSGLRAGCDQQERGGVREFGWSGRFFPRLTAAGESVRSFSATRPTSSHIQAVYPVTFAP